MATTLRIDTAPEIKLVIAEKHSFELQLTQKDKVTGNAVNFVGTPKMVISTDPSGATILMTLTLGAGITVVNNVLTISRNVVQNTLPSGEFFFDIRFDNAGTSVRFIKGIIKVNPNITDA